MKELRFIAERIKKSPLSIVGLGIVLLTTVIAIFAPVIAPPIPGKNPYMIIRDGYSPTPRPPSPEHPFGTTEGQYDIFYGCIWGTRTAFRIGLTVGISLLLIGIVVGSISGYYGGLIDEALMRIVEILAGVPSLIVIMTLAIAFGASLESIIKAYVLMGWGGYSRLMRAEVIRLRGEDFVEAARAVGCSNIRIIVRHIMPNAIFPIVIKVSMDIGSYVLYASGLTFLGVGAPYGYADWGQMITLSRNWIMGIAGSPYEYWYTFAYPGLFIFMFVLGWSLLGDAFRDILDPMLRRK